MREKQNENLGIVVKKWKRNMIILLFPYEIVNSFYANDNNKYPPLQMKMNCSEM